MESERFSSPLESVFLTDSESDKIALLQDCVPQLESLFNISHCIGHGTFSSVYLARTKHTTTINGRRHFAIKHIIPTSHPSRVYMELKCLKSIGGEDNVMGITMCFREMNHIVLVMPYFPHHTFPEYVGCLSTNELQDYLINLLRALRRVHSYNIIHRDVKPANFLYNRKHRRYSLVDFGLAQEVGQPMILGCSEAGRFNSQSTRSKPSAATAAVIVDTPHLTSTKTVKRKLGVSPGEAMESERNKRVCRLSPPTSDVSGILSSTTSRVNPLLRRSPRKQCNIRISPKKENFGASNKLDVRNTPKKLHQNVVPQDSPSKHTRKAEAACNHDLLHDSTGEENISCVQGKNDGESRLRRSPRKMCSNSSKHPATPLEGLAKHLHDVTLIHVSSRTPAVRIDKNKVDLSTSITTSVPRGNLSQRQRQARSVITCSPSPRVSGITATPDQLLSKPAKNTRMLQEVHTEGGSVLRPVSCHCYGSAKVCGVCVGRGNQVAPRAGTPGFRAPEVLLRHPDQGTAVDMWSVGVILLCLLSGRYPFFRAADDLSTLAEIITILGTSAVRKAAAKLGKLLTCSEDRKPLDLMKVCEILRNDTLVSAGANAKLEQCTDCFQRGACVCLIPPTKSGTFSQGSGHTSKKRTQIHVSDVQKKGSVLSGSSCVSPGKKRTKGQMNQMTPEFYFPLHSRDSLISSINKVASLDAHSQQCGKKVDAQPCEKDLQKQLAEKLVVEELHRGLFPDAAGEPPVESVHFTHRAEVVYPPLVYHLLLRLLDPNPETRITAEDALSHPFLSS
ncbi:cell division cycle 7-related protein kinase-like isoform X2 [Cherax quadricarinatus]